MKRILSFLACAGALTLSGCTGETALPEPTGKADVRAINAMHGSPAVHFRIEERSLATLTYKSSSPPSSYDNFEYNFNFDIDVPGESEQRRVATVTTQLETDRDHTFVLTGTLDNPTIYTWLTDFREWGGSETVFDQRFAHLSATLGDIDVYFQDAAEPLAPGGHVARLSFGEVSDFAEIAEGEYAITVTAAGDLNVVHFVSASFTYGPTASNTTVLFDGDANDTSPYVLSQISSLGQSVRISDPAYPSTMRFINGAQTLGTVDIYRDETLTDLVVAGVEVGVPTADLEAELVEQTFYFTPAGSTATTLFSSTAAAPPPSAAGEFFIIGDTDDWGSVTLTIDRAPSETIAKFNLFHAAFNNQSFEVFLVDRGAEVTENDFPVVQRPGFALPTGAVALAAGSYDVYVAAPATRDVIGGPYALDVVGGDIVMLMAIDDPLDTAAVLLRDVSPP